ncbi:MAG: BrnT family toxin [Blastocatellia bacterium]
MICSECGFACDPPGDELPAICPVCGHAESVAEIVFEWHQVKADANQEKHGVSFDEACTVFDDPFQMHKADNVHSVGEQRFICTGMSAQGRVLMISYTEPGLNNVRLISAREATLHERREYESQSEIA